MSLEENLRYLFYSTLTIFAVALIPSAATASGISGNYIVGQFSNLIFNGCFADAVTLAPLCSDNTATAVYSVKNASLNGGPLAMSELASGTSSSPPPGVSPASTITFTGGSIPATHASVPFVIGGLSYTNGTSNSNSVLFGATLNLFASDGFTVQPIGSETVLFNYTINTGNAMQNADFVTFSGLAGQAFQVYEGATATGALNGLVVGDPQVVLTSLTLDPGQSAFALINNEAPFAQAPEPSSLVLIGAGLLSLYALRHRNVIRAGLTSLLVVASSFGAAISVNGICETGTCASPDIIAIGNSATTSFNFTYTFANTDQYQVAGSFLGGNTSGPDYTIPYTVTYLGNAGGGNASADVLTIDFLQNYQYTRTSGTFTETLRGGFAGPIDPSSTVQGRLFVSGQALPVQGSFSPPSNFSVTLGGQAVSGLGNPLFFDIQRTDTFGAGSGVGASIINATPSTVPEPSSLVLFGSGLGLAGLLMARRKRVA